MQHCVAVRIRTIPHSLHGTDVSLVAARKDCINTNNTKKNKKSPAKDVENRLAQAERISNRQNEWSLSKAALWPFSCIRFIYLAKLIKRSHKV